jgi:RimJ/RimL family protein N-acetyltransferase
VSTETSFNPVLLEIPDQLTSARLLIRAVRPGDGALLHASVVETLDDLRRYPASLPWAMEEPSVAGAEEFCRRGAANWIVRADLPMMLFHQETGDHVGNCGLHRFDWNTRVFEIGWWCRKRYQGQGFMTEAASALTAFAFEHLGARRVWCLSDEENERSWRIAERLGFDYEGTLRGERCDPDGTRRSMRIYATTR